MTRVQQIVCLAGALTLGCSNPEIPSASSSEGSSDSDSETASDSAETETETETGGDSCPGPGPWDAGWTIPAPPEIGGSASAGEWALVHRDYVNCGIPYDLFMLSKGLLGTFADGQTLPWREGKNADLPYNWNLVVSEGGTELATLNCLTCHAGEFNGELIIGLGRHDADFTIDLGSLLGLLPILPEFTDAAVELNKSRKRYDAIGPYSRMYTVGTNPADDVAVILAAHRDPFTLEWSDEPLIPIDPPIAPVDPPPWWRVAKKHGHFYNGMSRGDHRGSMMYASSLCIDSTAQAVGMLDYFADIHAYLSSIEAPTWPWAVDEELAAAGEELFECNCSGCHGTYDADDPEAETYPNLLIPLEIVDTDPVVAEAGLEEASALVDWYNSSWYGTVTELNATEPFIGYTPPPLDGIWATAPYLHNGSVPSLEALLDSSKRPRYWRRLDYDSTHYDQVALGWPFQELDYGQSGADPGEAKYIYDTTILGHGNGGHTFGDHLDAGERQALLEYLKLL